MLDGGGGGGLGRLCLGGGSHELGFLERGCRLQYLSMRGGYLELGVHLAMRGLSLGGLLAWMSQPGCKHLA